MISVGLRFIYIYIQLVVFSRLFTDVFKVCYTTYPSVIGDWAVFFQGRTNGGCRLNALSGFPWWLQLILRWLRQGIHRPVPDASRHPSGSALKPRSCSFRRPDKRWVFLSWGQACRVSWFVCNAPKKNLNEMGFVLSAGRSPGWMTTPWWSWCPHRFPWPFRWPLSLLPTWCLAKFLR